MFLLVGEIGPSEASAKLFDENGRVVSTVDQSRTVDPAVGLRSTGVLSAKPVFGQRTQGGTAPWQTTANPRTGRYEPANG
ncbi:hypothetical protein ABZ722_37605 [Streptomyces longwoodensis]|uniref:hypothetical protein n=1 Tax=Streptomyces longwoodensis TaxID=68231 RepID=UPI0033E7E6CA